MPASARPAFVAILTTTALSAQKSAHQSLEKIPCTALSSKQLVDLLRQRILGLAVAVFIKAVWQVHRTIRIIVLAPTVSVPVPVSMTVPIMPSLLAILSLISMGVMTISLPLLSLAAFATTSMFAFVALLGVTVSVL